MRKSSPLLQWFRTHVRVPCVALLLLCFSTWTIQVKGADGSWNFNGSGNWTDGTKWTGGVPNGIGEIATIRNDITTSPTITLDAPITLGGLRLGDALGTSVFTFAGSAANTLTLDNTLGNAFVSKFNGTTDIWQAPLILTDSVNWNIHSGVLDVTGASNVQVSYSGAGHTIKNGAGTLRLNIDATTNPYTGDWIMNLGTLNIGGANSATPTSLGTGSGGIILNGSGVAGLTIFSLNNNGVGSSGTIAYNGNNDVILQGGARINVDRNYISGANSGNTIVLDNLTMNGGILESTGGNSYNLRFSGETTLVGETSVFAPSGATHTMNLAGVITDGAATHSLIKEGTGRLSVTNAANTYGGITAVKNGVLHVGAGANLGAGATYVNGGILLAQDKTTLDAIATVGLNLVGQLGTTRFALPSIAVNQSYGAITGANTVAVTAPIAGMTLGIDGTVTNNIDMSLVAGGSNRVWLSNVVGLDTTFRGTLTNDVSGDLRLTSGGNTLIIDTTANALGGAGATNNLVFGVDHNTPIVFTGNALINGSGGTVSVRVNSDVTLGTVTVNRGVTVNINGSITTPLGDDVVTALGGTISTDASSSAQFGNTDFRLFGGSTLFLDNSGVTTANSDRRLLATTDIDLTSSTLRLIGDGSVAITSAQTVNSIDYSGGSTISVDTDATTAATRLTTLTTGSLNRLNGGTLNIRNIGTQTGTFGTAAGTQKLITTAAPTITNDMIGANIALWGGTNFNDASLPLFTTYNATHGVEAAVFDLSGAAVDTAAELATATAGQIVSIDALTASMAVTTGNVQALRIRTTSDANQSVNTGTITIGSLAGAGQGSGLFFGHSANNTITHSANFNFGGQEGLLYVATTGGTSGVVALSGQLTNTSASGLTRFGDGILSLTNANNTFNGPLNLNAGETRVSQGAIGAPIAAAGSINPAAAKEVNLWGGLFYLQTGSARYNANVNFYNDARFGDVNISAAAVNNITVQPRSGSSAPVVAWFQDQAGSNITTAYGNLVLNGPAQLAVVHATQINGMITGTGTLERFMNERLYIGGDSSGYSAAVTAYAGSLQSLNSSSTAKPFGTGAITLNPGSMIRLAAPTNINASQLSIHSDRGGISGLGLAYVADPATSLPAITVNSSAPWKGFFGVGAYGYSLNFDQTASGLWGGDVYLGAVSGDTGIFTGTLTPTASSHFLLGGGQGTLRIARALTGANDAVFGISMTGDQQRADQSVNNLAQASGIVEFDVPMTYTGDTVLNSTILRVQHYNALDATGDIIANGGQLRTTPENGQRRFMPTMSIGNDIFMKGDFSIQMEDAPADLALNGDIALSTDAASVGVVRTLSIGVDGNNAGNVILNGGITDGLGSGNHFVKAGYGTLFLKGTNTLTGSITVTGGLLGVNSDADFGTASQIVLSGGGLGIFENSFTSSRNLSFHGGNSWFDITSGLTFTQAASSTYDGTSFIMKRGMGTVVLNGTNAQLGVLVADGTIQVNSQDSLGNATQAGAGDIQFGGDWSPAGGTNSRHVGGTLRLNFTGASNRGVTFNNNGSTNYSGGIDVTSGNTFTLNGALTQGSEFDHGFKTGAGTLITTANSTSARRMAMVDGTWQFGNSAPWFNAVTSGTSAEIQMLGGTIHAINTGADIAVANGAGGTTNYNYGGGMHLRMTSGAGFEATLDADSLLRQNQGTLVLETGAGTTLGAAVNTNAGRLLVTNAINTGIARASALTNGIFAAHLIGADSAGTAFFLQNDATDGFEQYSGATTGTLSGVNPTGIGEIVTDPVLSGSNNSIYAFRTTSDITGGTLKITAIDNLRMGGILINGSNTISSNLVFDPTSATAPGTGTPAEGAVYVKTGETATLSGNVTANAFTKFGDGTLVLSGTNLIAGDVSVQDGTMRLAGGSPFSRMNSELNINGGATLDLNGTSIAVETLGANNRLVDSATVGGQVTNTSGTQATLSVAGPITNATNWTGTINGNIKLMKAGSGVLNIDGYRPGTPDSGNNAFTGGTDIYGYNQTGGINLNNATLGLGGNGVAPGDVNLYGGTLGLLFSGNFIGIPTGSGPRYIDLTVPFGQDGTNGYTVNVKGNTAINVNQVAGAGLGQGNVMQIGALNMTNNTLQLSGANAYRLGVKGTTTIQGRSAIFQTNSDSTAIQLDGKVTGAGALNKTGDGVMRTLILSNITNDFSGGLNIQGGDVQNPNAAANTLGSGPVRIFPEGTLRIAGNSSVIGANLQTLSRVNSMGAVVLDNSFNPTVLNSSNFSSAYNTTLQIGAQMFSQSLNLAAIGDGRAFLGNGTGIEARYLAESLGAGVFDAWNPGVGVYRIVGGTTTLAFEGPNNVFTGNAYMQAGPQRNMVLGAVGNGGSSIAIRNSNNYSGGTQVAEGITLVVETGGSPVGETPMGTGAVEVYGTLQLSGSLGSNWKADANGGLGGETNSVKLRPGGQVRLIDGNTQGSGGNLVAGDQGRWGNAVGIDLNGGIFRYDGASNWNSFETIGTVDVRKGGTLTVARSTTASSAQLTVGGLNRIPGGTLSVTYNTGFLGTNLTTPLSYERLLVTGGVTLSGTTSNGALVLGTNDGIAPVWIVDANTNSYLGYDPTGTGTGFQPLVSAAPGAGEIAYNKIVSGALTAGGLVAGDIVDITTNSKTLADDPTFWAMRFNQNIGPSGGNDTITIASGGFINTGTPTVNPTTSIGAVPTMAINFGAAGAGEAIIYNAGNMIMQAQMNAALGLTKFGGSGIEVRSINPGIGGDVTMNAGTITARVPFSGQGVASPITDGVFNGQDIILNGGTLQLDSLMANAGQTASEIASNVRATAIFNSNIRVRADAGLGNNGQANYVRISNLTFENAGGATAMNGNGVIALALRSGIWVDGTTTLIPQASFNMTFDNFAQSTFAGQITESGVSDLEKFGNGTMTLLNAGNNYTGGTTIWGTTAATLASTVASGVRGAGTPFGTGDITVNPGGLLRIADNANIASNKVYLKSDGIGLAGLGIAHNNALPTIITTGTPTAGQVKIESTGPFGGVLALDYGYYSQDINLSTIGNGDWWLGSSLSADTYYFNDTLGANSNAQYQLGGGGSQGNINFGSVLVSGNRVPLFEGIFSGGTANTVRIEAGALTADLFANGPSFVNGNAGIVVLPTRNLGLVGDVRVNTNTTLALGNNFALGNGRLVLNGGALRYDFGPNNYIASSITIDNNVLLQGDWSTSSGNEFVINGNVAMHDGTAGATRIWNLTGSGAMAVGLTAGSSTNGVISGSDGSNLIKRGAQQLALRGNSTYEGYTQIDRGQVVVVGNVLPGVSGPLGVSNSPIILGVESTNNVGSLGIGGKFTIGRDIVVTAAPGTGINLIEARTNERAAVTGGISVATGAILTLGAQSGSNLTGSGGRLEITGPISGAGAVVFGTTATATSFGGTVGLLGNVNGYGINTYSGGSTFNSTRVEIGGDTLFSGPAASPTIISGPFGTGAMTWTSGEGGNGAAFLAVGGPRTIVNAFAATNTGSGVNATFKFMGHEALTFTRNWDLQSGGTVQNRTFQVNNLQQPTTFSGNFSNTGTQGSNVLKTGSGLLVLTGTNANANLLTTDGNYGTSFFIDDGILRVNSDAALGNASLAAAGSHLAGPADIQLRGGYLSIATGFTTLRQMVLTSSAGGFDVASGQTLTLSTQTRGAQGIRKVGPGTLALNNAANTITNLTLGGGQQLNPNIGFFSATGGTVSTTATGGTPFAATSATLNSGTLSLIGGGAAQALTIPTVNYGASGAIALNAGSTTSTLTVGTTFARQGAFNSVNYGTLTINPSALANLGVSEKVLVTAGPPTNTATGGGDILSVPSIFVRLAAANSDANFARYDATGGLVDHNVTTVATLGTSSSANVADIGAADIAGAGNIDIQAVRTSANIAPTDGTTLVRIARGGLILNSAATVSAPLLFGTGTGASLTEAIVYGREDGSNAAVINGGIAARDFTKTGPGIVELGGIANSLNSNATRLPVLSVQNGTLRFANAAAQFTNSNRPAAVNSALGSYVLNVNEGGVFDLNGIDTTVVGGLTGNGTVTSNGPASGIVLVVQNGYGVDPTFSGLISNGTATVTLTKRGNGILNLNGHGSYTGGTIVEAGRVTNATGSTVALGQLDVQTVTALGNGPITLRGGNLRLNGAVLLDGAQTTNEVVDGIDVLLWGGSNGYDITVASTAATNGVALPANTTSVLRAATQNAAINNLTIDAPILTSTEGLVFVTGTTTFSQANTVLRTAGGRVFLQGQVSAPGKTITKTGSSDLVISHTESGAGQNAVGLWKVYGGILNARSADGAANPLGAGAIVEINGGSTGNGLQLNTDGDGTVASERVMTYADTTVRFGSDLPVSSNEFVMSSNGRIMVDRILGNNDEKTVVIGSLQIRGALGSPSTLFTNANRANLWVEGTTDFQRDWQMEVNPGLDTAVTFNGVVSGNGTVIRKGYSGSVLFNAENTWNGGLFITGGGNTLLGSLEGNQVTLSNTAKFGTGHVFLGPLSTLQVNAAGNLRADQNFYVSGNLNWAAPFSLAADLPLDTVRLRSAGLGGIQVSSAAGNPTAANYYLSNPNPSASVLALGSIYTQALDQRAIGDGMWFIGSATNLVGANGSYDAATLAPGLDNTYRLGGGGATLFFGSNGNANVLTDTDPTAAANLIVGAPMTIQNGGVWGGGNGIVVLLQDQNYTGSTLVSRSSTLDFRGSLTTSGIETYGVVNVAGEAGTFINPATSTNIPVTLRPGSTLRFDNTSAGVLPTTATEGRWQDSAPLSMSNSILRLQGNPAVEVSETVGAITSAQGTNQIQVVRGMIGRGTELRTPGITRLGNSTVQLTHNGSQLGTDERVIITGTAPTVTNGMVAPWMVSASDNQFVTYNADTGFTLAGFDRLQAATTLGTTLLAPNDRTLFSGAVMLNAGVDFETYALRLSGNVTLGTATDNTAQLIIGSGGLLVEGGRTITAGIVAGSIATPTELLLYNNSTTAIGEFANPGTAGQVLASGITKFGAGTLQFLGNNAGFTGDIRIQQGTVELNYRNTTDVSTNVVTTIGGAGGNIVFQGAGTVLNLLAGQGNTAGTSFTGTSVTFQKGIVLGDYLPVATIFVDRSTGSASTAIQNKTVILTGGITFGASNNDVGQILRIDGRNGYDLQVNGTVTLNGRSAIAVENAYTGTSADALFDGLVTGTGTLIKGPTDSKTRELTLRNVTSLNNWTDGTVLQGGTLRVFAKAPNVATNASTDLTFGGISTGDITLMQGLLDLRLDNDIGTAADTNLERVVYADTGTMGPNVFLNGSTQINVDRTGLVAAGGTKQIVLGNLTMGQQWLTVTGGNSYSLEFGGTTTLLGSPYFNNSAELTLNGAINTDGGGVIFNKTNTGTLWINSSNPTLAANIYINAGLLAFGNRVAGNNTANLGAGDIFVNPGASIHVRTTSNINTAAGQQVVLTGTPYSASVFRSVGAFTQTEYQNMIVSGASNSNQVAVIALEADNNNALDFSSIGNGRLYFGANGDRTYGAASLLPGLANLPNSVVGGGSTNAVYRFTHTTANTLTINLSAGGLGDSLDGTTDVQVGNLATLGTTNQGSTGYVYFRDQNTYTGQTVISRGMTLRFNVGMAGSDAAGPLGIGSGGAALVDVYGGLRIENGGSVRNIAGDAQYYTNIKLHPGSVLTFQDMTAGGNRWHDTTGINLDGSTLVGEPTNDVVNNTETVGALTFDRGSRIQTIQGGTGDVFLTAASVTRAAASTGAGTGKGTLVFVPADSARFGLAGTAGDDEHQVVFTAAPTVSATSAVTNMLPGYYMDGTAHRFVTYGAAGTVGVAPVGDSAMVGMPTGAGTGAEVVNITANTTMGSFETTIFALRSVGNISLNSPTGANNDATITFAGSGADVGAVVSSGSSGFVINPNLKFGATGTNEALFYTGTTLTVNGNITAGGVTKFGVGGTMVVANDQSDAARGTGNGYSNGWVVNEGALQFGQFGSAGNAVASNTIVLNGAQTSAQLNLRAQPADTLLNYTYTSGKIYAVDNATIDWSPGTDINDRVHSVADIEIQQSGGIGSAPANGTVDAHLRVAVDGSRNILSAGTLTVASNAILNVDTVDGVSNFAAAGTNSSYLTNSMSSGMSVASIIGANRFTKWGDGTLYVRGASASFSGPMIIDQGAVFVTNNGSLGTGDLIINRYGTLEIGVANFVPTNISTTYNEGSMERWSVDSARFGAHNLGKANLQIAANQPTTNAAITLNGGGIQAYLRGDDLSGAQSSGGVLRILNPNVTFDLAGDSFLGDRYFEGANGLDSGKQTNDNRPMEEFLASGALLEVQGVISGVGGLTKVGYDTVILSGQNTYQGATLVTGGKLMVGVDNALPTTTALSTTANGVLDLNGQNQTVGALTNVVAATSVNSTSGFITNSGTTVKTLTVGNGVSSAFAYDGVIQHNVALTKTGSAAMTLHNANTYMGATTVSAGTLALGLNGSIHDSPWINISGAAAIFDVSAKTNYTFDGRVSGGGTDAAGTTFATVTNAAKISGNLIIGDHQGEISGIGSMAPGGNSLPGAIATAGDQIGHIYTSSDLTLSGPLAGTLATPENRLTLQLNGATANILDLGYTFGSDLEQYINNLPTTNPGYLNGADGNLAGHDYVNVGGNLTLNEHGRIAVGNFGAYTPSFGDLFNLADWGAITANTFNAGTRYHTGSETGYDLDLPVLGVDMFWDTSKFLSYGVVVVVPEPSRMLLLFFGLMAVFFRRRRAV